MAGSAGAGDLFGDVEMRLSVVTSVLCPCSVASLSLASVPAGSPVSLVSVAQTSSDCTCVDARGKNKAKNCRAQDPADNDPDEPDQYALQTFELVFTETDPAVTCAAFSGTYTLDVTVGCPVCARNGYVCATDGDQLAETATVTVTASDDCLVTVNTGAFDVDIDLGLFDGTACFFGVDSFVEGNNLYADADVCVCAVVCKKEFLFVW